MSDLAVSRTPEACSYTATQRILARTIEVAPEIPVLRLRLARKDEIDPEPAEALAVTKAQDAAMLACDVNGYGKA